MKREFTIHPEMLSQCPQCGSHNIPADHADVFHGKAQQQCRCEDCGFSWTDVYIYAHSYGSARPESNDDLIDRIIEVSKWSPIITQKVTHENCVLLEKGARQGVTHWVAFQVGGLGFTIDFDNHTASRSTAYDKCPECGEDCPYYGGGNCGYELDPKGVNVGDRCSTMWAQGVEPSWAV